MKKFICMLLCASLILLASSELVYAKASNSIMLLSDMSEDECIAFIKENGVKIPPYFENESEWGAFVKQAIIMYENNPNALSPYNHYITSKFFKK